MDRSTLQRIALFGGPIGYIALGLVHPMSDPKVGDETDFVVLVVVAVDVVVVANTTPNCVAKVVEVRPAVEVVAVAVPPIQIGESPAVTVNGMVKDAVS